MAISTHGSTHLYPEVNVGPHRGGAGCQPVAMVTFNSQNHATFSDLLCEAPGLEFTANSVPQIKSPLQGHIPESVFLKRECGE